MTALWLGVGLLAAWSVVDGVRNGVVRRAVELVGLILVFLFAATLAHVVEPKLVEFFAFGPKASYYGSWAVVLIGGIVLVRIAASGLKAIVHLTIAGWLDRVGGAVLGLAFGLLLGSCLFVFVHALPVPEEFRTEMEEDEWAGVMLRLAPSLYDLGSEKGFFEEIRTRVEPAAERMLRAADELGEQARDAAQ